MLVIIIKLILTGISTGNIELRADGKFHEWSIFNQHPAGAAKIQVIDDVFMGVRAGPGSTASVTCTTDSTKQPTTTSSGSP